MLVKIDKGIPMPIQRQGRYRKYPFPEMEVGDSFFVKSDPKEKLKLSRAISTQANYWHNKTGRIFTTRTTPTGIRVWRLPDVD